MILVKDIACAWLEDLAWRLIDLLETPPASHLEGFYRTSNFVNLITTLLCFSTKHSIMYITLCRMRLMLIAAGKNQLLPLSWSGLIIYYVHGTLGKYFIM